MLKYPLIQTPVNNHQITIRPGLYLSPFILSDKAALLEHLTTRDVYNTTLNIPFPYTGDDADWWLNRQMETLRNQTRPTTFALREESGKLIGSIGAEGVRPGLSHKAEIGYWLAKPFWGRGIMTVTVGAFVNYALTELEMVRLTAHVFEANVASARVLEKNGFKLEGMLRKHFIKDGQFIDARLYALLKEEFSS